MPLARLAFVCVFVGPVLVWTHNCQASAEGQSDDQCPVALLQRDSLIHTRRSDPDGKTLHAPSLPSLSTWGTTFFSTDPEASADFFVSYFKAVRVPLPPCGVPRAAVRLITVNGNANTEPVSQTLVFVNDPSTSAGAWNATQAVSDAAALILQSFGPGSLPFVPWIDNHDGYTFSARANFDLWNMERALADGMPLMAYKGPQEGSFIVNLRAYVPGTLSTVSIRGAEAGLTEQLMQEHGRENPEQCRVFNNDPSARWGWSKSTHMAAKPAVAVQFMVDILGAVPFEGDFPWPPQENCTAAQWALFPDIEFEVHFVLSQTWEVHGFSIQEQAELMDGTPALKSGTFSASMYNSLVLSVDSLDQYVLRLQAQSMPFRLMRFSPEQYALFMVIPENAITVQLRSQHLSVDVAVSPGMCTQDFGNLVF